MVQEQTRAWFPGRAAIYGLWDLGLIIPTSQVLMWPRKQMTDGRASGSQSAVTNVQARLSRPPAGHTHRSPLASAASGGAPALVTCFLSYLGCPHRLDSCIHGLLWHSMAFFLFFLFVFVLNAVARTALNSRGWCGCISCPCWSCPSRLRRQPLESDFFLVWP